MRKWSIYSIVGILIALTLNKVNAQKVTLLKTTTLTNYPSASGIAYNQGRLFIMGDDATQLLILNTEHILMDSVTIFKHPEKRIHYTIKPDLEALTLTNYKGKTYLAAIPSFSSENRNQLYVFPLDNIHNYTSFKFDRIRYQLTSVGIVEPNLEGVAVVNNSIITSNRANLAQPFNYLITIPVKKRSLKKVKTWKRSVITLSQTGNTLGLSGLEYFVEKDILYFTASSEATSSATADGAIGESYLGYVSNYSQKKNNSSITPDVLINLSKELGIGNQKIEGVCIESRKSNSTLLHLVADNDDGKSIVYKVQLEN